MPAKKPSITKHSGPLKMEPGADLLFKVAAGKGGDFKSTLVGMQLGRLLIMTMPGIPGVEHKLRIGHKCIIRYLRDGTVYGFQSKVLHLMFEPYQLLFAAYPSEVERLDLRQTQRIACLNPCRLYHETGEFQVYVVDLSKGGCRVNANLSANPGIATLPDGSELVLDLQLCGDREPMKLPAVLMNTASSKRVVSLGLRFGDIAPDDAERITAFIAAAALVL